MRSQPQKCTATKAILFTALLLAGGSTWAASAVGTVTRLSGPLLAKKADGTMKILSIKSEVEQGDTLMSEKNTYAQIRFVDNGEMTVRPDTILTIENYFFDLAKPDSDRAAFNLQAGGVRSITGLLGKRNHERFALKTPDGTVGVRGTTFTVIYVPSSPPVVVQASGVIQSKEDMALNLLNGSGPQGKSPATRDTGAPNNLPPTPPGVGNQSIGKNPVNPAQPPAAPVLAPGLHLQVTDGAIIVTNTGGSLGFQAGQFGYVPSVNQPPVIVPSNPGIQFVPPPSFNSTPIGPASGTSGPGQGQAIDCIVR